MRENCISIILKIPEPENSVIASVNKEDFSVVIIESFSKRKKFF